MAVKFAFDYEVAKAGISNFKQNEFDELKQWTVESDKNYTIPKNLTDSQLLLFYNSCNCDCAKSKKCIINFYQSCKNGPELFNDRILSAANLKDAIDYLEFSVLPKKSPEGYDIIFHRLYNTDPYKYNLESGVKMLIMTLDVCLYQRGPSPGVMFLFDMRGVKLTHLTRVTISTIRKFFFYIQEALPMKMKAIHVMNAVSFFDKILVLLRPFMKKEFIDMIRLHTSKDDMEKFYATVLPRECLPPDYGGTLPDTQTLHKQNLKILTDMEQYFIDEEAQRMAANDVTSSCSKQKQNGSSGVGSNFKSLNID